jgi:ADP-heptose:LPS heptosyltransferase
VLVVSLALGRSLASLGRRRPSDAPRRILVAHHLLLGDTLMLTPLLAKLRERYPAAEIVMTTPRRLLPLYENRPYGVKALVYDPRDPATLRALWRQGGYDLAIVPGDNRHAWLARALGARWIVAFAGDRPGYKSWLVDELVPYPDQPGAWGDMVAALIPGPPPAVYHPEQWSVPQKAGLRLPPSPYVVLHVGASTAHKLWPAERWRILAERLTETGQVVWSAGPEEREYVAGIDPDRRHHHQYVGIAFVPLWHLLKGAKLLISTDTSVAHFGRVVGVPTVTLFGPSSAVIAGAGNFWRMSPYRAVTIEDFPCRDQRQLFKREISWVRRCFRGQRECADNRCMQALEVDMVLSAVASLTQTQGELE